MRCALTWRRRYFRFFLQKQTQEPIIFPALASREIDFVKKEEELRKSLDEKDKWYKEQLETLQQRVRAPPWTWGWGGEVTGAQRSRETR